jgi:putative FmdB family regulatory protein
MPIYEYRREDGSTFEIEQKITDDPLETCPETEQPVTRLISGGSFHLKGSGFYETDYVRNNDDERGENGSAEASDDAASSESNGSAESAAASSSGADS